MASEGGADSDGDGISDDFQSESNPVRVFILDGNSEIGAHM